MNKLTLPIEIINKILVYKGEINNELVITQYHPNTCDLYFTINFFSSALLKLNSVIIMKLLYPLLCSYPYDPCNRILYYNGLKHYCDIAHRKKKPYTDYDYWHNQ